MATAAEAAGRRKGHGTRLGIAVILFTAGAAPLDVEKGFSAGADDYIVKPFTLRTLQDRVAAALDRGAPAGS
jgi:DNA-binding response OmpR family regulator